METITIGRITQIALACMDNVQNGFNSSIRSDYMGNLKVFPTFDGFTFDNRYILQLANYNDEIVLYAIDYDKPQGYHMYETCKARITIELSNAGWIITED